MVELLESLWGVVGDAGISGGFFTHGMGVGLGRMKPHRATSCRKKKSEEASFLADLRDHIDEFVHASMDKHKTCFTKTIQKMFGMSKVVAERNFGLNEVESSLPLQTIVSEK
ncbi:uncharacterized protein LOC131226826 [Magnolia sinica]|uniref:uncharacterized protein LOC131226826 n=1 Tax=Magnolia sinica TaxID=86752 RepID=UPI00265A4491|nr:uncharacterized protein LOC131226826 [Magnolia sinica]